MSRIRTAFVAGAGLGKRLRPLTSERPKPLVPVWNRPLITYVFDALIAVGIERFVVNTHHCAEVYAELFEGTDGRGSYRDREVRFVFEPVLLETGGGIKNASAWFRDEPVLVHNGDVLASLNLRALLDRHARTSAEVTLLVRSKDGPLQVRFDPEQESVTDFRDALNAVGGMSTLMTGAYVVESAFVDRIPSGEVISVIPVFLDMLRHGVPIAGVLDDTGSWADLGNRESYLAAHRGRVEIHPDARISANVTFGGFASVGANAEIGEGAVIEDSVIWENAKIASGSRLRACIVRDRREVSGIHANTDF